MEYKKELLKSFYTERAKEILTTGRYFSLIGLVVLFYFIYQDIEIFHHKDLILFRGLGMLSFFSFLIFSFVYRGSSYKMVAGFYFLCLIGTVVMLVGIVFVLFLNKAPLDEKIGAIQGLIFVVLITALFSLSLAQYLFFVNLPVFLLPVALWWLKVPYKELSLVSNCIAFSMGCVLLGFLHYRWQIREFFARYNLNVNNKKLTDMVRKLSVTVERLEREIDRRKRLERELKELSMRDELTNTYNRRAAMLVLESEIKEAEEFNKVFSICFLDLDDFKKVNDLFGHKKGDEVLIEFAKILKRAVREKEDMVFRLGGDEFLLLLRDTDGKKSLEVIKRINEQLKSNKVLSSLTFSVGVAQFKRGISLHDLIKEADKKMYEEKRRKKSIIVF